MPALSRAAGSRTCAWGLRRPWLVRRLAAMGQRSLSGDRGRNQPGAARVRPAAPRLRPPEAPRPRDPRTACARRRSDHDARWETAPVEPGGAGDRGQESSGRGRGRDGRRRNRRWEGARPRSCSSAPGSSRDSSESAPRSLGLSTEASRRYESRRDPEIGPTATARFLALLRELSPDLRAGSARERNHLPPRPGPALRASRCARLLA